MSGRALAGQGARFAVVGVAATLVHLTCALLARHAGASPLAANLAGYVAAVGVSYLGNALWTFRRSAWRGGQLARFVVVSLAGLAANQAITWVLVEQLRWPFWLGLAVVVVAVPALSFVGARLWAFREPGVAKPPPGPHL